VTRCDRCGGTDGRIEREAHVDPLACIRALQKQVADGLGIIVGMANGRAEARDLAKRLYAAEKAPRHVWEAVMADAQVAVSSWDLDKDMQKVNPDEPGGDPGVGGGHE